MVATIYISSEIIKLAKEQKLNVSAICREAILKKLGMGNAGENKEGTTPIVISEKLIDETRLKQEIWDKFVEKCKKANRTKEFIVGTFIYKWSNDRIALVFENKEVVKNE